VTKKRGAGAPTNVRAFFACCVVGLAAASCADRGAAEARAVAQAISAFEQAAPGDRAAALEALKTSTCSEPPTCAWRDACVGYGAAFVRARELMDKARALGPEADGGNGAATESERAIILAGAQDALQVAEQAEPACHEALERLHARASGK
jgi:hypothetical protein